MILARLGGLSRHGVEAEYARTNQSKWNLRFILLSASVVHDLQVASCGEDAALSVGGGCGGCCPAGPDVYADSEFRRSLYEYDRGDPGARWKFLRCRPGVERAPAGGSDLQNDADG